MTTDNRNVQLGTLVDATGAKRGFQEVKDAAKDMAKSVEQSGQQAGKGVDSIGDGADGSATKVDRATKSIINSIQRATAAAEAGGKSGGAYFEVLAGQRGVNVDALKPYLTQLDDAIAKSKAANDALSHSSGSLEKVGISAKQTAAALRGVPAQFTDIAVGLAGGQNPLTVLLQQGGQLKDMFGGIGPAARALGGYVAGLVNPFTVTAAAASILATAFVKGGQEASAYSKAIVTTGNYVGQTVSTLGDLSRGMSQVAGTQSAAAEALATVAGAGKIASSSLQLVATAALEMERTTGTAISKTVAQFVDLAEEPTKASIKLNDTLHYLTLTTFEHIRSLEEQGRKEEAAAAAQQAYARAIDDRTQQIKTSLGTLPRAWSAVADAAKSAWDAMLNAGRPDTLSEQIAAAQAKVDALQRLQNGPVAAYRGSAAEQRLNAARAELELLQASAREQQKQADNDAASAQKNQAQIAASQRVDALKKSVRSEAQIRQEEIEQLKRDAATLGLTQKQYDDIVKSINEKHKDPTPKAYTDDEGTRMLQQAKERLAVLQAQGSATEKMTAAEQELVRFEQLIASLQGKKLTDGQKTILAMQDQIRAVDQQAAAISRSNVEKEREAELEKQAAKRKEALAQAIDAINISMESSQQARSAQYERELSAFGLGDRYRQNLEAEKAIREEYRRQQVQLDKKADTPELRDSDAYKKETQQIKDSLDAALASRRQYYEADAEARKQWENGASRSLANFLDRASDVSSQTEQAFTRAFDGITDVFTNFIMTGKGGFEELARSVVASLVKIQVEAVLTANGTGGLFSILGNLFGLSGKAGSTPGAPLSRLGEAGIENYMAMGGVYDRAGLLQSANGNIFDRATLHGYGNGKLGVLGENGPEAVMPLKRGRDGKLGLAGGGGTTVINQNFAIGDLATMRQVRQEMTKGLVAAQAARARSAVYGGEDAA